MQVLIASMGLLVTAIVVAGMILMAPGNTEPNLVEPERGAAPLPAEALSPASP